MSHFIDLNEENIKTEHLCCAIADKKHQIGVDEKRTWLTERMKEGHVFRKLEEKGKVFIEYAPLESAWVPVIGDDYIYIYCLWVSGSFKDKGHGRALLTSCIEDAKQKGKSGVCLISSKKKKPFLADKKFMEKFGFKSVDSVDAAGDAYELLALSFDGSQLRFADPAKKMKIDSEILTIYHSLQCPYIANCIKEIEGFCEKENIPLQVIRVNSSEEAKAIPGVFNNWAVFYKGRFETLHLLNEGYLKKMLDKK